MARYQNPDEVLAELKRTLGPDLAEVFHKLETDLVWLHMKWRQYRELYGTSQSRLDLLNESAPLFFRVVQDSVWEDTLLSVARLTDRTGDGSKRNLSICHLPDLVSDPSVRLELEASISLAIEAASFARDWRNRRIAHRDLNHALDPHATPLAAASRQRIEEALTALRNVLNTVNKRLRNTTFMFEPTGSTHSAVSLLYVVRDGLDAQRAHETAMREGRLPPEQWGPPRPV